MIVMAIDPGPTKSAFFLHWPGERDRFGISRNQVVRDNLQLMAHVDLLLIEKIGNMGMPVGEDVYETVYQSGRIAQVAETAGISVERRKRGFVKSMLCHNSRAKDSNIVCAIVDRYDPLREYGRWGKGSKKKQGPLYGLKKDVWQALALLLAWADENGYQVPINGFNPAPAQEGGMRMK